MIIVLIGFSLLVAYLTWAIAQRDGRIRELDADRERLLDRIRYLQDGPPRVHPGPVTGPDIPLLPSSTFFTTRKPDL